MNLFFHSISSIILKKMRLVDQIRSCVVPWEKNLVLPKKRGAFFYLAYAAGTCISVFWR